MAALLGGPRDDDAGRMKQVVCAVVDCGVVRHPPLSRRLCVAFCLLLCCPPSGAMQWPATDIASQQE